MNAKDVKKIGQFINGEHDPLEIDINSLFFLMVLTQNSMELMEKLFSKSTKPFTPSNFFSSTQ
jgi:hypothetical protein